MEKLLSQVNRLNIINPKTIPEIYYSKKITNIGDKLCKYIKSEGCVVCGKGEAYPKWELSVLDDGCTYSSFFLECDTCHSEYSNDLSTDLSLLGIITQRMNKEVDNGNT